jgi:hypothetical protein
MWLVLKLWWLKFETRRWRRKLDRALKENARLRKALWLKDS